MSSPPPNPNGPPPGSPGEGGRGRTLGVAVGAVALLVVVAVVLVLTLSGGSTPVHPVARPSGGTPTPSGAGSPAPSTASPTPTPTGQTFPYVSLAVGQCLSAPSLTPALKLLTVRSCTTAHDAEVTGLVALPAGLTGDAEIGQHAGTLCDPVNQHAYEQLSDRPRLRSYALFPDLAAYTQGTRTVTCALSIAGSSATKLTSRLK